MIRRKFACAVFVFATLLVLSSETPGRADPPAQIQLHCTFQRCTCSSTYDPNWCVLGPSAYDYYATLDMNGRTVSFWRGQTFSIDVSDARVRWNTPGIVYEVNRTSLAADVWTSDKDFNYHYWGSCRPEAPPQKVF